MGRPCAELWTPTLLFDHVRKLFAATPDAKRRRFDAGRFSFNLPKGRCETCEGEGFVSVEMLFMPSVYAPCPTCHGARFNEATLAVRLRDQSIADVLSMTVDQGQSFFASELSVARPLKLLSDIGLGYLRLGQRVGATLGCDQDRSWPKFSTHSGDVSRLAGFIGSSATVRWRPQEASASDMPCSDPCRNRLQSLLLCILKPGIQPSVPAHCEKVSTRDER
jgi:hypothetical protein